MALIITFWGSSNSTLPEQMTSSIAVTTFEYWSRIPEAHGLQDTGICHTRAFQVEGSVGMGRRSNAASEPNAVHFLARGGAGDEVFLVDGIGRGLTYPFGRRRRIEPIIADSTSRRISSSIIPVGIEGRSTRSCEGPGQ